MRAFRRCLSATAAWVIRSQKHTVVRLQPKPRIVNGLIRTFVTNPVIPTITTPGGAIATPTPTAHTSFPPTPFPLDFSAEVKRFDPLIPIESAWTPPSSWYIHPDFLAHEKQKIFARNWQYAGCTAAAPNPGDFFTGEFLGEPYIVVRGTDAKLRAFYNVCRHHAARLTREPSGCGRENFTCPYHGWTYSTEGRLLKATKLKGIKDFKATEFGLMELPLAEWGPFVFLWFGDASASRPELHQLLQPITKRLPELGYDADLTKIAKHHILRREYLLRCNWKIANDNYLDGEYHIPYVHPGLNAALNMNTYHVEEFPYISFQISELNTGTQGEGDPTHASSYSAALDKRPIGPLYAFIYPNFFVNRYGIFLETNHHVPLSHEQTLVVFDYYVDERAVTDRAAIESGLQASHQVQLEDLNICENIHCGLSSKGYVAGRYSPRMERATYHFHVHLARDLQKP